MFYCFLNYISSLTSYSPFVRPSIEPTSVHLLMPREFGYDVLLYTYAKVILESWVCNNNGEAKEGYPWGRDEV